METKKAPDVLLGPSDVAAQLGVTTQYAGRLMQEGAFGVVYDVGSGEHRARPRVRQSGVDKWLAARAIRRASA